MNDAPNDHVPAATAPHSIDALIRRLRGRLAIPGPAEPLYARLSREIAHQITSGHLTPGETLPGERVLAERLALSRVTVRKAINGLAEAGQLIRRPGAGTQVARRVEKSLTRLTGFSEDIAARGLMPGCIWLRKERVRSDINEARALEIPFGSLVLRLQRIRTASGAPIAVERAVLPASIIADPTSIDQSLYVALEAVGAAPMRAVQRLRAQAASANDASHLRCDAGAPLLVMERRCFDAQGRVVECTETRYLGEAYDFITEIVR